MYIKELKVRNYKKLIKFDQQFGQLNVVIGKNNAGKTTVLKILNSFLKKDGKVFKGYEHNGETSIKITTTDGEFEVDWKLVTPKWVKTTKFDESDYTHGFIGAQHNTEELIKALQSGVSGFIKNSANTAVMNIEKMLLGYEMANELEHNITVKDEGGETDYSLDIRFNLEKAFTLAFNNSVDSIIKKGLGQQKEFVLRQFSENNQFEVDVLIIDEIENSLSMDATSSIVNSLMRKDDVNGIDPCMGVEKLQVFYSTHNATAITAESKPTIIPLGSEIPSRILNNLGDVVFVEGPTDATVFSRVYTSMTFIPGGGSQLPGTVKSMVCQGHAPKVIVDGDAAGIDYKTKIEMFLPGKTHSLVKGTIEDYCDEIKMRGMFLGNGVTLPKIVPNLILEHIKDNHPLINIKDVKNKLQKLEIDDVKLKTELDLFL